MNTFVALPCLHPLFEAIFHLFSRLQGKYPTLRSPTTLLALYTAWPEGLGRAHASTPKAENGFSCGELGMRVAFCCLAALL